MFEGLLTVEEAGVVAGVTPGRIRHVIADGRLRAWRKGRDWWIVREDLEAYLRAKRRYVKRTAMPAPRAKVAS